MGVLQYECSKSSVYLQANLLLDDLLWSKQCLSVQLFCHVEYFQAVVEQPDCKTSYCLTTDVDCHCPGSAMPVP